MHQQTGEPDFEIKPVSLREKTVIEMNGDRTATLHELGDRIMNLTTMHIIYGLDRTPGLAQQKQGIAEFIQKNRVNIKKEMDPLTRNLYHRYFA